MLIPEKDEKILKLARERFQLAVEAEREIRAEALIDLKFLAGEQWDPGEFADRKQAGRPALTFNKLPQFVDQVTNEQRRNRPGPQVVAMGSGSDDDTADISEGIMRHIENRSHADIAYDTAFEYSASCSFGYWRIETEYLNDSSFDQELKISPIADPFAVYLDPGAMEPDKSDMRWAMELETLTREEFKRRYPKCKSTSADLWDLGGNPAPDWIREDGVRIAAYWDVTSDKRMLELYADGSTRYSDDPAPAPDGVKLERSRPCEARKVTQYIINGAEILETNEWAGKYIPIVPVYGKTLVVDGKRKIFSLIRFARDPQQLYNYMKTSMAEAVGLSPKAPFIGYVGQFKTKMAQWQQANRATFPFLEVDPIMVGGQPAPFPQRNQYEPPVQALSMGALGASDDIKATTGLFDPSLGIQKSDQSGTAVKALQEEGNNSNFHLVDNLTRSLLHNYRILLDLIPKIYDAPRAQRIVKPDHESEVVLINQMFPDKKTGQMKTHDLSIGEYDVSVSVGASYETRRAKVVDHLIELAKADPNSLPQWADLYVKQLDMGPIGDEIAMRLTPPQYRDQNDPQAQMQHLQSTLQQMGQQNQALTAHLHDAIQKIESRQIEAEASLRAKTLEIASRERIAAMTVQANLVATEAKINAQNAQTLLGAQMTSIKHLTDRLDAQEAQSSDQDHEAGLQQADQDHQATMQATQQDHQAGMQQDAQQAAAQQATQQAAQPADGSA